VISHTSCLIHPACSASRTQAADSALPAAVSHSCSSRRCCVGFVSQHPRHCTSCATVAGVRQVVGIYCVAAAVAGLALR
jgi:hypothetical protein